MASLEAKLAKDELKNAVIKIGSVHFLGTKTNINSKDGIKQLSNELSREFDNLVLVLGSENKGKALLTVSINKTVVDNFNISAGTIIKTISREIQGGGGGQAVFATAGGKNPQGLDNAIAQAKVMVEEAVLVS